MKKLVAVTTTILIILLIILGVIVVKEKTGIGEKTGFSINKFKQTLLNFENKDKKDEETLDSYYEGALLRVSAKNVRVTYEGPGFTVNFMNPIADQESDNTVCFVFYDNDHGYMLNSLGQGNDSEFFDTYYTEDGCETWVKCKSDVWFDLDAVNSIQMIGEKELVYVHTAHDQVLDANITTIQYSPDMGNNWYDYKGNMDTDENAAVMDQLENMSLEEKVAQMFMISPESLTGYDYVVEAGSTTYACLEEYPVGGIIYSSENVESEEQCRQMLENIQSYAQDISGLPLLLALDTRNDVENDTDAVNYGFNLHLEELDKIGNADDELHGICSFPDYEMTQSAMSGMRVLDMNMEDMKQQILPQYENAIRNGAEFMMISHMSLPQIDSTQTPASLSNEVIQKVIREEMGYKGVLMTDSLKDSVISSKYTPEEAAVRAIEAGVDVIVEPSDFVKAYDAVIEAVENGTISEERINKSVYRILNIKIDKTGESVDN